MDFHGIISFIGNVLLLINLLFYIGKTAKSKPILYLIYYLLLILLSEVVSILLWKYKIENLFLSHFYFTGQFVLLGLFYREVFKSRLQKNIVNLFFIVIFLTLGIQYSRDPALFYKFNILEIVLTSVSLILFSLIHFYNSLSQSTRFMYVNSGILLYLISSTLLFSAGNFINESFRLNTSIWVINAFLYVVFQGLIFIEWYKNYRKPVK